MTPIELSAYCATAVMGWKLLEASGHKDARFVTSDGSYVATSVYAWHPHEDRNQAMEVAQKVVERVGGAVWLSVLAKTVGVECDEDGCYSVTDSLIVWFAPCESILRAAKACVQTEEKE